MEPDVFRNARYERRIEALNGEMQAMKDRMAIFQDAFHRLFQLQTSMALSVALIERAITVDPDLLPGERH